MWDEITGSKNPNERSNPNVHRWRNSSRKMRYMHEIDYYPVFKRNRILMNAPTWMNLLCKGEQNRHERTNTVGFQLYEVSGIGSLPGGSAGYIATSSLPVSITVYRKKTW